MAQRPLLRPDDQRGSSATGVTVRSRVEARSAIEGADEVDCVLLASPDFPQDTEAEAELIAACRSFKLTL